MSFRFFLKHRVRQWFARFVDKYVLKGALVRITNGYLDIERRPYIELLIKLPHGVTEYDPTEIIQQFLHQFNHGSDPWTYGGGFIPAPYEHDIVFFDITPTVRILSKQRMADHPQTLF